MLMFTREEVGWRCLEMGYPYGASKVESLKPAFLCFFRMPIKRCMMTRDWCCLENYGGPVPVKSLAQ